jgi:hypothetical protein
MRRREIRVGRQGSRGGGRGQCFERQSGCMQLQCSSTSGAFLQYSLQYLFPAGTTQWQLGWAHLLLVFSAIGEASTWHYAPRRTAPKAQPSPRDRYCPTADFGV